MHSPDHHDVVDTKTLSFSPFNASKYGKAHIWTTCCNILYTGRWIHRTCPFDRYLKSVIIHCRPLFDAVAYITQHCIISYLPEILRRCSRRKCSPRATGRSLLGRRHLSTAEKRAIITEDHFKNRVVARVAPSFP